MDPMTMGLITGGANLLGSIFTGTTSASNTQAQIAANQQMVQQQEQFQEQMSNTAYQRSSADMKAAGLNPMMMFGSGGPASSPSGASISQTVNRQSPLAGLGQAANAAVSSAVQAKTMDKMADEMANLKTTNEILKQDAVSAGNRASLTGLLLPGARNTAFGQRAIEDLPETLKKAGAIGPYVGGAVSETVKPALDVLSTASGVRRTQSAIENDKLMRDINKGNFIGKYGTPVDEYLKQ